MWDLAEPWRKDPADLALFFGDEGFRLRIPELEEWGIIRFRSK